MNVTCHLQHFRQVLLSKTYDFGKLKTALYYSNSYVCMFFSKTLNFLVLLNNEDELILDQYLLLQEFQLPWKETLCFSKKKKKNQVWQKKKKGKKVLYLLAILLLVSYFLLQKPWHYQFKQYYKCQICLFFQVPKQMLSFVSELSPWALEVHGTVLWYLVETQARTQD